MTRRSRLVEGRTRVRSSTTTPPRSAARRPAGRSWFRIENRADAGAAPSYAEVYLYDEIGMWGVTAGMLVAELGGIDADEIDLHLNSPGGEVWDGIAIYNALINHRAAVTVYVDGIAASAASVVAMAGDRVVMARGSQLMIHDAWGLCVGNAAEMRRMGDDLDRESNNIAGIYADRAGGTARQWRKAMEAESWYTADEAVTAGLADEVATKPQRRDGADVDDDMVENRWDLSIFAYAGREKAPGPTAGTGPGAHNPDPPVPPRPDQEPPADEPEAPTEDDPADEPLEVPDNIGDLVRAALADAADDTAWDGDMADVFRAAVTDRAENAPAPPAVPPAAPTAPTTIDPIEFATALKEALQ